MPHQARSWPGWPATSTPQATPEVALLRSDHFAWVMAIFAEYLTDGPVPAAEFHEYVDLEIRDLRANGVDIPDGKAREHCNSWVRKKWLNRALKGDDEEYSLTAASLDALAFTDRLIHRRSTASESRLKQIIDAVARLATEANPDPTARVRRLDEEIARLSGERLSWESATYAPAPTHELREQLDGITDLIRHLPSDFKRVSDSVYEMHKKFIAETSEHGMSRGDMLREFFAVHDLLTASDEGRAFAGLMTLLSNTREQAALRRDLTDLLQQDFAATLTREERALLRDLLKNLVGHSQIVQDTYRRLTQSLERYVDNRVEDDGLLSNRLAAAHTAAVSAFSAGAGTRQHCVPARRDAAQHRLDHPCATARPAPVRSAATAGRHRHGHSQRAYAGRAPRTRRSPPERADRCCQCCARCPGQWPGQRWRGVRQTR